VSSIFSILATNYSTVGQASYTPMKYTAVDPDAYQGQWTGTFSDNTKFSMRISNVQGFRATVTFKTGSTVNSSQVLIANNSFRIGDSKFVLAGSGQALVAQAVTDPVTGAVIVKQGYASRS